ncbi:unnamed protein product [Amaranthus hypochondriacus]
MGAGVYLSPVQCAWFTPFSSYDLLFSQLLQGNIPETARDRSLGTAAEVALSDTAAALDHGTDFFIWLVCLQRRGN